MNEVVRELSSREIVEQLKDEITYLTKCVINNEQVVIGLQVRLDLYKKVRESITNSEYKILLNEDIGTIELGIKTFNDETSRMLQKIEIFEEVLHQKESGSTSRGVLECLKKYLTT